MTISDLLKASLENDEKLLREHSKIRLFPKGYNQILVWGKHKFESGTCSSLDDAKIKAIWYAEIYGWTNPRWYEFWRHWRGDTRFDPAEIERLKVKYEGDNQLSEEVS